MHVKLDRWDLQSGKGLWDQIEHFITNPDTCDAWLMYATQYSMNSKACKEEFELAFYRSLKTRGDPFPIIALFPSGVDEEILPKRLALRLCVSVIDPEWKERIKAVAEGRELNVKRPRFEPFAILFYKSTTHQNTIEMRPRAGQWSRAFYAILSSEWEDVGPWARRAPSGHVPQSAMTITVGDVFSRDHSWRGQEFGEAITPSHSIFLHCKKFPSKIAFGALGGNSYIYEIDENKVAIILES